MKNFPELDFISISMEETWRICLMTNQDSSAVSPSMGVRYLVLSQYKYFSLDVLLKKASTVAFFSFIR